MGNRKAQHKLYQKLTIPMMGVCLRYMKNQEDAEDVLLEGFYKVFSNLENFTYQSEIAFFGWVKRIMVNESLMKLRKDKDIQQLSINEEIDEEVDITPLDGLNASYLLNLIQSIPIGYRTVFNLYEIEGYTHEEIADKLGISKGTSKSQLFKAKKLLREKLTAKESGYGA